MRFSSEKRLLKDQKSCALSTFLIALGVAAACFLPYIFAGKGYFVFFGDFNAQQIPFYKLCHEAVRSGNMGWSHLTDLGANFVGSYSFYLLGSPFFWLTVPFPNAWVPYFMGPLLMLKFACAALTAYFYLRRFTRKGETARLGGLLYAFSGFSVYNIFFNHFHEALIVFPLLLLALELLMTERRTGVFALAVALCAVTNYFFFFGMVVFCVLYFFVRVITGAVRVRFTRFLQMLFEAVLGLLLAMFLLLPSLSAILGNGRVDSLQTGWDAIMYGKEQIYLNIIECFFFPPDLPARPVFFPGAEVRWSSLGGWMPVFGMVGVFAWFFNRRGNWLRRMLGICFFMAMVPVLNSAFYAFNTAYYARWFYMPILLMCLATVLMIEDQTADWNRGWKWVFGITLAFGLVIGFFPQKREDGTLLLGLYMQEADEKILHLPFLPKVGIAVEQTYFLRFWVTVLIAVSALLILRFLLRMRKGSLKKFTVWSTVAVCVFSVIYTNIFIFDGRQYSYDIKDMVIDRLIEGKVDLPAGDDYRIDVYEGMDNAAMYLEYPSINAFHSVVPPSIINFYEYVGETRDVASRPEYDNVALRTLLSVKYLLNAPTGDHDRFVNNESGEAEMYGFRYIRTSGGFLVYENDNYTPYGYSYNYYMTKEFCDRYEAKDRAAWMTKAVLLTDEQIKKYGGTMQNIETLYDVYETDDPDATTMALGEEALATDAANLRQTAATEFSYIKNGFTATVSRTEDSLVFFSVPYDNGFTATVNGKPVEIEQVNVGFMAVPVTAGVSHITFTYQTPGLAQGVKISCAAAVVFVIYLIVMWLLGKKHPPQNTYPEGDELLHRWHNDERFDTELPEEDDERPKSFLHDPIEIPPLSSGFEGGFKIDMDPFDDSEEILNEDA